MAQHVIDCGTGCSDEALMFYLSLFFSHCEAPALGNTVKKERCRAVYFDVRQLGIIIFMLITITKVQDL